MLKKVEFVYQQGTYIYNPQILIIDLNDISFVSGIDENMTNLETKSGKSFKVFGKLRTISNRIMDVERVDNHVYDNINIRPSLNLKYKFKNLQVDNITMDAPQVKAFIDAFFSGEGLETHEIQELYLELDEHTQEAIKNLEANFWKPFLNE